MELVQILSLKGQRDETARVETWIDALNRPFDGFARALAALQDAPEPFELGVYEPPTEVARRADELRPGFAINDPHAIIRRVMTADFGSDSPDFERTDYAVVRALREAGEYPALLSAQAVIVSTQLQALLVHFRDPRSATYPRCFHTIGGAFQPSDGRVGRHLDRRHDVPRGAGRDADPDNP